MTDSGTDSGTDAAPDAPAGPVAFTKAEVQTLFDTRCAPCHVGGA